jgi:prepilin-type N-terminal cleavage/methylation domain-containing protein
MMANRKRTRSVSAGGFTLIELLVTLALVGLVSLVAVPLAEISLLRQKESELRLNLRTIRVALDAYKAGVDAGEIARDTGASGYPPTLEVLVSGVDAVAKSAPAAPNPVTQARTSPQWDTPAAPSTGMLARTSSLWDAPMTQSSRTSPLWNAAATPATAASAPPKRYYFLRKVPRDPFFYGDSTEASQTWALRSYASRPDTPQPGADVFDVTSRSNRTALDGTPYSSW